ncbi:MAG: anaerobic ribonucleoside-triphosphate reductase activating protein [Paludibacteraceae bacterium]|nr:anaerobic ribonucleoside-triphosphate reductase activating protein [Paludibacteraceae bacterium]
MLKFVNYDIVFQEVPNEISLAINISGCPCRCPGCHSSYLWQDIGDELNSETLDHLIESHSHISCVAFMGGDGDPFQIDLLASHIRLCHPNLRVAWYSGKTIISPIIDIRNFDYIKIGPYINHLGALNKRTTNQRLYRVKNEKLEDITHVFWH